METKTRNIMTANWIGLFAAILLIASPYIVGYHIISAKLNDIYLGIVIGVISLVRALYVNRYTRWLGKINVILGFWLIIAPFLLGYTFIGEIWDNIILGIAVFALNIWGMKLVPGKVAKEVIGQRHN
jgi:hypothetical protein